MDPNHYIFEGPVASSSEGSEFEDDDAHTRLQHQFTSGGVQELFVTSQGPNEDVSTAHESTNDNGVDNDDTSSDESPAHSSSDGDSTDTTIPRVVGGEAVQKRRKRKKKQKQGTQGTQISKSKSKQQQKKKLKESWSAKKKLTEEEAANIVGFSIDFETTDSSQETGRICEIGIVALLDVGSGFSSRTANVSENPQHRFQERCKPSSSATWSASAVQCHGTIVYVMDNYESE